ncbi:hypothetical protein ACFHYQ_01330 [Sphaerimonospora cavernae]|uniref:PH domain-containing protein n=1 Tax=Sphaerimonospora cavernae TaxID=1740611 RepID=A0ABV6TXM5_9ACTN
MTTDPEKAASWLQELAAELKNRRFSARVRTGENRTPCLHVVNLAAPVLTESVITAIDGDGEWCFFFPWPQRIAPVGDLAAAADRVERVLAEIGR